MPLARFERLPPERREALLEVAARAFASQGYEAASLNAILAEVGIGKSSYYYYFSDKEDLFATVMEARFGALESTLPPPPLPVESAEAWWSGLEGAFVAWMRAFGADPVSIGLTRALQDFRRAPPLRLQPLFQRSRALYTAVIEEGQRLRYVRADLSLDLMLALLEAIDAVLDEELLAHPSGSAEAHARTVVDTFRRVLAPGDRRSL